MIPRRVAILGSTGSVGRQALDVIRQLPEQFEVAAIVAGNNTALVAEQVAEFRPRYAWAAATSPALEEAFTHSGVKRMPMEEIAVADDVDIVLVGTSGATGLLPTLAALGAGKGVAIANKEPLVMAGHLVRRAMAEGGGDIRPVDSEHSAVWQCLWGEAGHGIRRIILTASGGAFRDLTLDELAAVTPEQALNHPTWNMGPKITVDSASLMNKGMETIEAMWLFDVSMDQVEVILHRESIVHSLVEFSDGSVKAQLGLPDMRLPIQCALAYPDRLPTPPAPPLDLATIGTLNFGTPDTTRFPCLGIAMAAGRAGETYPTVMAAADEVAVERFMARDLGFMEIPAVIEEVMSRHIPVPDPNLDAILEADRWARAEAKLVRSKVSA